MMKEDLNVGDLVIYAPFGGDEEVAEIVDISNRDSTVRIKLTASYGSPTIWVHIDSVTPIDFGNNYHKAEINSMNKSVDSETHKCYCETRLLINFGCKCGGI